MCYFWWSPFIHPMTQRYARQMILPALGAEGQARLANAKILCVGAGGLGSPALLYLAAAGVGHLGVVDDDVVDLSNLHRQILFKESNIGQSKTEKAKKNLSHVNRDIKIVAYPQRLDSATVEGILPLYDIVLDGSDNLVTKYLLNDACLKYEKPLIYASVLGFEGQVSVFGTPGGPCYRCLYPHPPKIPVLNCAEAGVLGPVAGMVGMAQALQALYMALGLTWCEQKNLHPLVGKLWLLEAQTLNTRTLKIPKNPACSVCSLPRETIVLQDTADAFCSLGDDIESLSAPEALARNPVFIDVRELSEQTPPRLMGALAIPLRDLLAMENPLKTLSPERPIVVYCQHGIRSVTGARHLKKMGYQNIAHLQGGIIRWPPMV
jgi:adenylyltransferase/sulfurtransferase